MFGVVLDTPEPMIVMEYCPCGSLKDLLTNAAFVVDEPGFEFNMANNVASAMAYLHAMQPAILHNDLKAANVLVVQRDGYMRGKVRVQQGVGWALPKGYGPHTPDCFGAHNSLRPPHDPRIDRALPSPGAGH